MELFTPCQDVWFVTGDTPEFIQKDLETWYQKAINSPNTLGDVRNSLAGNLEQSYKVYHSQDHDNFINSTITRFLPEINSNSSKLKYTNNISEGTHWINIQKKEDYNPVHSHIGMYSYVFWHKVPFKFEEEEKVSKLRHTNYDENYGDFLFRYIDYENSFVPLNGDTNKGMLSYLKISKMNIDNSKENTFSIFPAWLPHSVDPFYSVDEDRVTFSGNYYQLSKYNKKEKISLV